MNDFKVEWEDVAKYELNEIVQYIIVRGAPAAAAKLRKKIRKAAANLSFSPYRVFHNKKRGLRKVCVGSYLIVFRIIENTNPKFVVITQIIHGRRNLHKLIR